MDVISLSGSQPAVGTFEHVILNVGTKSGTIPTVDIVSGPCTWESGVGTASPVLRISGVANLGYAGTPCTVRASAGAAPGYVKPVDKTLTVTWSPLIVRARWTAAPAGTVQADKFDATLAWEGGGSVYLTYTANCSGPDTVQQSPAAVTVSVLAHGGTCEITGRPAFQNQFVWTTADTLRVFV